MNLIRMGLAMKPPIGPGDGRGPWAPVSRMCGLSPTVWGCPTCSGLCGLGLRGGRGGGQQRVRDDRLPRQQRGRVVRRAEPRPQVVLQKLLVQTQPLARRGRGGGRVDGGAAGLLRGGHARAVGPHAAREALLEAAVLAPVARVLGHLALLVAAALVAQLLADGALEESLAALAADGSVVATCTVDMI